MATPLSAIQDLASRLLAAETAASAHSSSQLQVAVCVCDKLRIALTRFAGAEGSTSLLRRALTLARAEVQSLEAVKVKSDGSMEGLDDLLTHAKQSGGTGVGQSAEAGVAIITHLLALLSTFIGESLTLRLVRDAWPGALLNE